MEKRDEVGTYVVTSLVPISNVAENVLNYGDSLMYTILHPGQIRLLRLEPRDISSTHDPNQCIVRGVLEHYQLADYPRTTHSPIAGAVMPIRDLFLSTEKSLPSTAISRQRCENSKVIEGICSYGQSDYLCVSTQKETPQKLEVWASIF
jgi:hypothetical protein